MFSNISHIDDIQNTRRLNMEVKDESHSKIGRNAHNKATASTLRENNAYPKRLFNDHAWLRCCSSKRSLESYRGNTANPSAGVGASKCVLRNDGLTNSSYPFVEEDVDQPVGRYVGSYKTYRTGLFEVTNSSTATRIPIVGVSAACL